MEYAGSEDDDIEEKYMDLKKNSEKDETEKDIVIQIIEKLKKMMKIPNISELNISLDNANHNLKNV